MSEANRQDIAQAYRHFNKKAAKIFIFSDLQKFTKVSRLGLEPEKAKRGEVKTAGLLVFFGVGDMEKRAFRT